MSLQNKCAKCGCEDNFLTTPPVCPSPVGCPFEECAEIQYAQCIMYTGDDILCFDDTVVPTDTNMAAAINNIVDYLCFKTTVANNLLCNTDVVVAADTAITLALANTVSYFCAQTTITEDLDCGQTTVVASGTTVVDAIQDVVSYFCDSTIIPANISCGQDVVVTEDSTIISAIEDVVSYFCDEIANINIAITAIEGNITTLQANQGLFDTGFRAALNPTLNVDTVAASLVNANVAGGVIIIMPVGDIQYQIVDGVTTPLYNTTTGIWTCPQTGKYDINYNVYLTCPDQTGFGWGNTPTTTGGAYSIAVTNPGALGGTVYCADTFFVIKGVYCSRIYLTGGIQGVSLTAGTQIVLRHQNMTGISYVAEAGDNIDWAIRRVG